MDPTHTIKLSLLLLMTSACDSGTGACIGESSPGNGLCKDGWSESECQEWDEDEVNGSSWTFEAGESCEDLGYTYTCSDGSFADNPC